MYTLGINAAFHDSAAALVKDGKLIAAAEEERFTHIKHGKRPIPFSAYELPFHAIDYCLREANIHLRDVDHIAYSFDPDINRITVYPGNDDLYLNYIRHAPAGTLFCLLHNDQASAFPGYHSTPGHPARQEPGETAVLLLHKRCL